MKKIALLWLCCLIYYAAEAQIVKGSKAIGGGISYSKTTQTGYTSETDSNSSLEIIPGFGYFVADGFLVGVNIGYNSGKVVQFGGETKTSGFMGGPFARYYKQTSKENFAVYGQLTTLFGSGKQTNSNNNQDIKTSSLDIALSPGIVYFINGTWAIELGFRGIGYSSTDPNKDVDNNEIKTFEVGLNSFLPSSLGFRIHF
jgi:hypothetical protein